MPKCTFLVGPPGVGKSTWLNDQIMYGSFPVRHYVASTDDIVTNIAYHWDMTYNEGWADLIKFAEKVMWRQVNIYATDQFDIIFDRTNMSRESRKKIFDALTPHGYTFEAVVFGIPEKEEWDRRLNSRPGKSIPLNVIQGMVKSFEMPTEAEGFTTIAGVPADADYG